mmetsp:Transcript_9083/g.14733  ORF Transcript_9083/g.14733 Transcript_9083/m.14733 type:complete len:109 (-) Transcript_9083:28-354(-)
MARNGRRAMAMAGWPPALAFHHDFEWNARELEVYLDQCRLPPMHAFNGAALQVSQLNDFGSHGWSLPTTPRREVMEARRRPPAPAECLVLLRRRLGQRRAVPRSLPAL